MFVGEMLEQVCGVSGELAAAWNDEVAELTHGGIRIQRRFLEEIPDDGAFPAMPRPRACRMCHDIP